MQPRAQLCTNATDEHHEMHLRAIAGQSERLPGRRMEMVVRAVAIRVLARRKITHVSRSCRCGRVRESRMRAVVGKIIRCRRCLQAATMLPRRITYFCFLDTCGSTALGTLID
eukprot:2644240-Pleurochrysis_carterae.AAC.4